MDTNKKKLEMKRRDFLKVLSVTSAVAATGCAKELPEKLIPYVVQPDEVIPGVAAWYASTCNECEARCGTLIRTREGRAVKVEGNPYHPVNRGGLCARGQSSIQSHYDPDRIREPLKRSTNGTFKPITWKQAITEITKALSDASTGGKKAALITESETGSINKLIAEFAANFPGLERYSYSLLGRTEFDASIEQAFGSGLKATYDFKQADVVVGFGADFLGTYLSPVEFTKGFAAGRVAGASKFYQIEPRLSQTGANADRWIVRSADSALRLMLALLKEVSSTATGKNSASSQALQIAKTLTADFSLDDLVKDTSVSSADIKAIAKDLSAAKSPLVIGEGVGGSVDTLYISHLLNAALGSVGSSMVFYQQRNKQVAKNFIAELPRLVKESRDHGVVIVSGVNPIYGLPQSSEVEKALSSAGMLVALANNIDDTSKLANIILPLSTSFESWSDSESRPGVFGLNQPSMQPLYQSLPLGDVLLAILKEAKKKEPAVSYAEYIKTQWKQRVGSDEQRWLAIVEQGGEWASPEPTISTASIRNVALTDKASVTKKSDGKLALLAFPTVQLGDGRAANRPWAQEIPDPITTAIWGSWIEINTETAKKYGFAHGDVAQVSADGAIIEAPAYVSDFVHPEVVAFPIGRGQSTLGRFANGVGANPLKLTLLSGATPIFVRPGVELRQSVAKEVLVTTQGHDSQENRGLLRTTDAEAGHENKHHEAKHGKEDNHGLELHEHDPHALGPEPERKQMYKQMDHVQYQWGMTVDLAACTGCSACVTACYAENNIAVVGKEFSRQGREMSWLKISRYIDGKKDQPITGFMPMMCQHCNNAPCEPVCPVYATYHSDEGLNTMVYNRCVGTRYCSNNCSYKVRRFNWFDYEWPEPLNWQLNPDVTVRGVGVMEKCTFCIQRIREVENKSKTSGREVADGEIQPACASSCPAEAITFGNLLDKNSKVAKLSKDKRSYRVLQAELNTQPAVTYLAKINK